MRVSVRIEAISLPRQVQPLEVDPVAGGKPLRLVKIALFLCIVSQRSRAELISRAMCNRPQHILEAGI
jgi:hypothetical protein